MQGSNENYGSAGDQLFHTPILFLIFKRPDTTKKVFEAIRKVRPARLFVAADGPRPHVDGEAERCEETRRVATQVDWPCEVQTLFRDENLGCGRAVSGAITWFFEHVPEGIILEDDTLPSSDFFPFCAELLERYRNDNRIMEISAVSLPSPRVSRNENSYYFSNWENIWGWATWKRAWDHYDYSMKKYEAVIRDRFFHDQYASIFEQYYLRHAYNKAYYENEKLTSWSYQWSFARKINSGLVIIPTKNMVVNLGLANEATNTHSTRLGFLKFEKLDFPLRHPDIVMHDRVTDDEVFRKHFTSPYTRMRHRLRRGLELAGLYRWILVLIGLYF